MILVGKSVANPVQNVAEFHVVVRFRPLGAFAKGDLESLGDFDGTIVMVFVVLDGA